MNELVAGFCYGASLMMMLTLIQDKLWNIVIWLPPIAIIVIGSFSLFA